MLLMMYVGAKVMKKRQKTVAASHLLHANLACQ